MEVNTLILSVCIIILLYLYMKTGCMKNVLEGYISNPLNERVGKNLIKIRPYSGQTSANPGVYTEMLLSCNDNNPRKLVLLNPLDVYTHQDGSQKVDEKYMFKQLDYNNDNFPTGVFNTPKQAALALCKMN